MPERKRCQTYLEHSDRPCGRVAEYQVSGTPGNLWNGFHCKPHTVSMLGKYDHQGGCVVRSLK